MRLLFLCGQLSVLPEQSSAVGPNRMADRARHGELFCHYWEMTSKIFALSHAVVP